MLNLELRNVITNAFRFAVEKERIYLRAFVVMPDHWHALFALREPWTLPRLMQSLMSYVGAKTAPSLIAAKTAWQDGYYETLVRTEKQFHFVSEYVLLNPVKKGLVENAGDWDATSLKHPDIVADSWPFLLNQG